LAARENEHQQIMPSLCVALSCALGLIVAGCGGADRESPALAVAAVSVVPAESCPRKPEVAANPPVPAGWVQVHDSVVTPEMAAWAAEVVNKRKAYPMCSSTTRAFGAVTILARVEWHPPDFNVPKVHRGVTLYEPQP
jgi:hypothetical protein